VCFSRLPRSPGHVGPKASVDPNALLGSLHAAIGFGLSYRAQWELPEAVAREAGAILPLSRFGRGAFIPGSTWVGAPRLNRCGMKGSQG
jgi:hypothetical protein